MPRSAALAALALAAALGGCGESDDSGEERPPSGEPAEVDLRVEVRPRGPDGPARVRRLRCEEVGEAAGDARCRRLGGLEPEDLAPVPPDRACTQVYGGPATARVEGRLRGRPVEASFELSDGCEIARWRRNSALLGPPPTGRASP